MTVTVRLTADEEARLRALSERTGRTTSFYVRSAIRAYLEDLEDVYAADEAMKIFDAEGRRTRPIGALMDELGLAEGDIERGRAMNATGER